MKASAAWNELCAHEPIHVEFSYRDERMTVEVDPLLLMTQEDVALQALSYPLKYFHFKYSDMGTS